MKLHESSFVALFLCLACVCIPASAQTISFAGSYIPADYCHGCGIVTGDLNGDGRLDIVMFGSEVVTLLGNGDGTFQQPAILGIDGWEVRGRLAVEDVNRDGKLDLLALTSIAGGGYRLAVLFGNGDATFQAPVSTPLAIVTDDTQPAPLLTTGDFNNDGKLDVAIPDLLCVNVFSGNGDGTFQTPPSYLWLDPLRPGGVGAADFNSDGKLDIFAGMYVRLGNGDGTFQTPVLVTDASVSTSSWGPVQQRAVVIADFDGDGKPDVVVTRSETDKNVTIVFGNGDGTFQPLSPQLGLPYHTGAIFAEGDFALDGKHEVVLGEATNGDISIGSVSAAGGTLEPAASFTLLGVGPETRGIVVGDLNGDNSPDLIFREYVWCVAVCGPATNGEAITILLNMRGTYVRVNGSAATLNQDESLTLAASVVASVNTVDVPTGLVAFTDRGATVGIVPLVGGQASVTVQNLGLGTHNISAYYLGDSNFNPNWSSTTRAKVRNQRKK